MRRRRLSHAGVGAKLELESGVFLNLLARHAGIERKRRETMRDFIKTEHGEIGHDAIHATGQKPAVVTRLPALEPPWACDEIDVLHEATLFVFHRNDHVGETGDVVSTAGAREARLRLRRITDKRAVEIAVLIDLGAAHESDIDITALQKQQNVRASKHHIGPARAALIIG